MADFNARLAAENAELLGKLAAAAPDAESQGEVLRELNFHLKTRIANQQKAAGEPADPVGLSPKEMKELRKAFAKFDKNGDGKMDAAELQQLANELAEPLSEEEIEEGMKLMDKSGNGSIDFQDFVNWMSDERDKDSHKGMKMRMLKLKMRANHFIKPVGEGLKRAASFNKDYVEVPENICRISGELSQGPLEEGLTKLDAQFKSSSAEAGRAAMDELGAPADAAACVCVSIALLDGVDASVEPEFQAMYDQIYDMVNGDEMIAEIGEQYFLHGKPSVRIREVDGRAVLQLVVCFTMDPFENMGVDSRYLKTVHGRIQWAHTVDELIKPEGMIDLMALEGLQVNTKLEVDRKILEWLSGFDKLNEFIQENKYENPAVEKIPIALAAALSFGSFDVIGKSRSVQEIFNQQIRDNMESYNEFIEEKEQHRYLPGEMLNGITEKMVAMYSDMDGAVQNIYGELKSKIAGPYAIHAYVPSGEIAITSRGLDVLHKFFPSVEEIKAHESFGGSGSDDDDWS